MFSAMAAFHEAVPDEVGERQQNEPGANAVNNCGPACGAVLMLMHGYPDIEPQDWIDAMPGKGPSYHGGTTPADLNGFIASRYSDPPRMAVQTIRADLVGLLDSWGATGRLAIVLVNSDAWGRVINYQTTVGHYVLPLEYDGRLLTVWNPDWGLQALDPVYFRAASRGVVDLCDRPLPQGGVDMNAAQDQKLDYVYRALQASGVASGVVPVSSALWDGVHPPYLQDIRNILSKVAAADQVAAVEKIVQDLVAWFKPADPALAATNQQLQGQVDALKKQLADREAKTVLLRAEVERLVALL